MKTRLLQKSDILPAASILRSSGLIALPTETVYGLAANALDEACVRKLFAAKGRPETKPISLFVPDLTAAERFCHVTDEAKKLSVLWPGPLTVILKRKRCVPDVITAGGEGVGIRVPDDPTALALLRLLDFPLTGTSANLSGQPSVTTGAEALRALDGRIDAVMDGVCPGGVPSTVVDLTGGSARVVRSGAISTETLESILGAVVK